MPNQTGPKSPAGKQASSQNSRRHGLATPNIIVHPDDQPVFDEMETELRNEVQPDGPLEAHAFQRLITAAWQLEQCRKQQAALVREEPTEQNKANLEKVHRYYLRWEGSYNSAFRQIGLLQTGRGFKCVADDEWPDAFAPLADVPKIERFAKRIARPVTFEDHARKQLSNQLAIMRLEDQIRKGGQTPWSAADAVVRPPAPSNPTLTNPTLCETKPPRQPEVGLGRRSLGEVGRNSPCPCGSGLKYKRCCGVNAPPILNNAA